MRSTFHTAVGVLCVVILGGAPATSAQIELDRVVGRVGTRVITKSDVQQARLLQLVDDVATDETTQRGLVDRLLLLTEVARATALPPTSEAEITARRSLWEARVGGSEKGSALLKQAGMTEAMLLAWCKDDLRIQAYLKRQFGSLSEGERAKATTDLLARLRQRAEAN